MAYVIRSGLLWLVAGVQTYLTSFGVDAKVTCGFKSRGRILTQGPGQANRIVFTPADDNGFGGRIVATRKVGERPVGGTSPQTTEGSVRAIRDWQRVCVVSVWSRDRTPTLGSDEDAREAEELEASETLIEWMMRAVSATGLNDAQFGDVNWTFPNERSFGLEARIGLTFQHPIFDVPVDVVRPMSHITKNLEAL